VGSNPTISTMYGGVSAQVCRTALKTVAGASTSWGIVTATPPPFKEDIMDEELIITNGVLLCSVLVGVFASSLNRSGFGYFIAAIIFQPLIVAILLLIIGRCED
jgi:hypothetical protein